MTSKLYKSIHKLYEYLLKQGIHINRVKKKEN